MVVNVRSPAPELDRLLADARRRHFDAVVVWRFDRFARSVSQLFASPWKPSLHLFLELEETRKVTLFSKVLRKGWRPSPGPPKGFTKAVRLAKIPHIRFHDLRHTFATRLVRAGADPVTVQYLFEHSKIHYKPPLQAAMLIP